MIRALLLLLLTALPVHAAELRIATWNLDWLTLRPQGDPRLPNDVTPKTPADHARLRQYVQALDADVVALQEVDGPEAAARIFPPSEYAFYFTRDRVVQRVGFAVRRTLAVQQNPDLVALDVNDGAPQRLRSGADITLLLPQARLRLLAIHLKTGCHQGRLSTPSRNCDTLRRQLPALQGWIAQRREELAPFLLLGDFNRRMDRRRDDLMDGLLDTAPLVRATEGRASPCWGGGSFIDHIIAGGPARAWIQPATLAVLVYQETNPAAKDHLSDHCPVSVQLRLPD